MAAMTASPSTAAAAPRWRFEVPTALGTTHSSYEITDDALNFVSDDVFGGSASLRWDSIRQGGTAAMVGMGGKGMPDLPGWVPERIEWLLLSRVDGGGEAFMRTLPQGGDRDAIVAALRERLGARWIGDRLPLKHVQQQLGVQPSGWSTLKVWGLVAAVLASLVLLIMLIGVLLHPVIFVPAALALGGWLVHRGIDMLGHADGAARMPVSRVGSAPTGLVALEGRAVTEQPTPAGISGRPCVWWDVAVYYWSDDGRNSGEWRQVASRSGGRIDTVVLEDATGRIPVWLDDARLLLSQRRWESGKDELPAHGVAFLESLGFPWRAGAEMQVVEDGMEAGGSLYVLGTLDERRHVSRPPEPTGLRRIPQLLRSGEWRRELIGVLPAPTRMVAAVLIGYLDMISQLGSAKARVPVRGETPLPDLPPATRMVWAGRAGQPFVVSDRPEQAALAALRRRGRWTIGLGLGVAGFALYALAEALGWV